MVLLMIYAMLTNVLLVNLLVAMMGSTYDRYISCVDVRVHVLCFAVGDQGQYRMLRLTTVVIMGAELGGKPPCKTGA